MKRLAQADRWHELLTTRYVCQICLTRFFVHYRRCPACHRVDCIRWLDPELISRAKDDGTLRALIARQGESMALKC